MNNTRNGLCGASLVLAAIGLGGCANSMTTTGEPGVKMGDSYEQVLAVVSRNNTVTKQVDGQGFRAEGYSAMFQHHDLYPQARHGLHGARVPVSRLCVRVG